jgi:TonB family protein
MELVPWLAKSTLLLALAFAAVVVLRKGSADLRHLVWRAVFAALLLLPLTVQLAPEWTPAAAPDAPVRTVITVFAGEPVEAPAERRWPLEWIWAAGAGVLLLRELARWARGQWVVTKSVEFGGDARVRLSEQVAVPAVYGIWRPVILLPAAARAWSEERLRVVLAHERMHVLRGDPAWFTAARVAAALWWPHPLVWLGLVSLIREAEQACDDGVLAEGTPADEYATHLVAMVRAISMNEVRYQGGLPMIRVSELERRLRAMLNPGVNRRPAARGTLAMIGLVTMAVLLPVATIRTPAAALENGIRGVVEDATGARVPGARVTVASEKLGIREIVLCNEVGEFKVAPLTEGEYVVNVAAKGFARMSMAGIMVMGGEETPVRVVLNVGGVTEQLTVRGEGTPRPAASAPPKTEGPPKRIAVGGSVQATRMEKMVRPAYPPECKAAGIQGTVVLKAVIGKDGSIVNLERVNKLVDERLADAAMEAVKQWQYRPTLLNGQPVEVMTEIEVNFTLAEKQAAAGGWTGVKGPDGGVYRAADGVTSPVPIYKVEPAYSEQARAAGFQGTVLLTVVVDEEGTPQEIKVLRALGMGLDEKAVEALGKWKFRPAMKDGKPVRVKANVEINFRIDQGPKVVMM